MSHFDCVFLEITSVLEENEESETEGSLSVCNKTSMPLAIIVPPPKCFYDGCITNHCQQNDEIVDLSSNFPTSSRDESKMISSFKHNHIISSKVIKYLIISKFFKLYYHLDKTT